MTNIILTSNPVSKETLQDLAKQRFGDMVKAVIDIQKKTLALGGELHADEEALLLQNGSLQEDVWGINIYIDEPFPSNIEFDSVINIRPSQNNTSRSVDDPVIQEKILDILKGFLL